MQPNQNVLLKWHLTIKSINNKQYIYWESNKWKAFQIFEWVFSESTKRQKCDVETPEKKFVFVLEESAIITSKNTTNKIAMIVSRGTMKFQIVYTFRRPG